MVDNDEQDLSSIQEDNNNTNKTFQNDINEFNEQLPTYSTITGKTITLTQAPRLKTFHIQWIIKVPFHIHMEMKSHI